MTAVNPHLPVHKRITFWMILPVLLVGSMVSVGAIAYLSPPMISHLTQYFESNLKLASQLSLGICEKYFNDLLNLRLEDDPEMNLSLKNLAMEEIKALSHSIPPVHFVVLNGNLEIKAASLELTTARWNPSTHETDGSQMERFMVEASPARGYLTYFPFWDWTIVSFVFESEFERPVTIAKTIVYLSTASVFGAVLLTLILVFHKLVNKPLRRVVRATESVGEGVFLKVHHVGNNELGQLVSSFNKMVDNLDRQKAEVSHLLSELTLSESRFRALFEHAPVGICVAQQDDGFILEANESLQRMLGYSKQEMKQKPLSDLFQNPDDIKSILARFGSASAMESFEVVLCKTDTTACQTRMTIAHTVLDEQQVLIAMVEDTTSQKTLEKQLQRAQKLEAVGMLAGGVAHDLNNILSGLVSYPELLLMRLPEESPLRKSVVTIQKSGLKAATIVQDLLALARQGVSSKEILNLNDVIAEYLTSPEYGKLMEYHPHIVVKTDLDDNLQPVSGSSVHLAKAFMNLISNAAEAIEGEGSVRISTKNQVVESQSKGFETIEKGSYATVSISDTGIGLSDSDKDRIFEPFYTRKKMGRSGTGLGMTVVWSTVKDHDGYVDITSTPGLGTEFNVYFPVSDKKLPQQQDLSVKQDYSAKGETVLFVDDMPEQRDILNEILEEFGYKALEAGSGEEALEILKKRSVDLVILDMIMDPGIDGLETYRRILTIYPGQKAIIASGYSETDRVREAERLGVGQYVKKPFTIEEIGKAIRKELDR